MRSIFEAFTPEVPELQTPEAPWMPCKCQKFNGKPCHTRFRKEDIDACRLSFLAMTKDELDIALLSKIEACIHMGTETQSTKQVQKAREQHRVMYTHHGHSVCRDFFSHIHGDVGERRLRNLFTHYKSKGVEARVHGLSKRLPVHALSYETILFVYNFILNVAEANAIILPGRQSFAWKTDVKLLPTDMSKQVVYNRYVLAVEQSTARKVSDRSFLRIWQQLLPFVRNQKPATDLCWYCQQRSLQMQRSVNLQDHEKSKAATEMLAHLNDAAKERSLYTSLCEEARRQMPQDIPTGPRECCSFQGFSHYSFDFAQQVHYPCDPQQPGPIFFKTPRKCGLFGVHAEGRKQQVNFVIDESWGFGKGANAVVSLLHFYY